MKKFFGLVALAGATLMTSCGGNKITISGTIDTALHADGNYIFLISGEGGHLDSALVKDNAFSLERAVVDSLEKVSIVYEKVPVAADLILESGNIQVKVNADEVVVSGTPLNETWTKTRTDISAFLKKMKPEAEAIMADTTAKKEEAMEALQNKYVQHILSVYEPVFKAHSNDIVGALALSDMLSLSLPKEKVGELLAIAGEKVLNHKTVKIFAKAFEASKKTDIGQKFTDFKGTNAKGEEVKLSQYVGNGHYTLVDFWASWCGPCRHEIPNLISIYADYQTKGLQVLGVAVWDEVADHIKAVEELKITYPQLISKQEATDLYGIQGIPEIILFAPDGTILARGLRGEVIKQRLEEELTKNGGNL